VDATDGQLNGLLPLCGVGTFSFNQLQDLNHELTLLQMFWIQLPKHTTNVESVWLKYGVLTLWEAAAEMPSKNTHVI
jgi:hypothetical protein